jgi:hypothetical protein
MDRAGCNTLRPIGGAGVTDMNHIDRAAILSGVIRQIVADVAPDELLFWLEQYLRDELADLERQIANDREVPDA